MIVFHHYLTIMIFLSHRYYFVLKIFIAHTSFLYQQRGITSVGQFGLTFRQCRIVELNWNLAVYILLFAPLFSIKLE